MCIAENISECMKGCCSPAERETVHVRHCAGQRARSDAGSLEITVASDKLAWPQVKTKLSHPLNKR